MSSKPSNREDRIRKALEDIAQRRAEGDELSDSDLIASHLELMPELGEQLSALHKVEQARNDAESEELHHLREAEDGAPEVMTAVDHSTQTIPQRFASCSASSYSAITAAWSSTSM